MLRDSYLAASLGFKGGTACYFFYNLPRFSVDLDFDIISKDTASKVTEQIFERTKEIVKKQGLQIRDEAYKQNTVLFVVSYEDSLQNIKIEISRRQYPNTYEIKNFYGLPVHVLGRQDMFAHKLVAATERKNTASRDFFDIWYFFDQSWTINEEIVRLRTGKDLKTYLGFLLEFIRKHMNSRNVLQGMGELLDAKQKTWVKNSLKKELTGIIAFYADSLTKEE
jgi:predicted nucleotidyltransferase component of viral defense system